MPDGRFLLGGMLSNSNSNSYAASVRVAGNGIVRPTIHFTLPASAGENENIPLTADIDTLANQPIISYQWDLDYNGLYFAADITGPLKSIAPWTFNGPSSHVIALRVVDSTGLASHITTTTLQINNAAPVPAIELAYGSQTPFFINTPVPIDLSFVDAPSDYVNRWSVDWGDGVTQLFVNKPASLFHSYAAAGTYGISVTARDNDNSTSVPVSMSVKIYYGPQIEGNVFLDNNANGLRNTGDGPMSGVVVWLDENNNGVLDDSEHSTTTDADGHYYLIDLPTASTSTFRIQTPEGYRNTTAKVFNADILPENQTQTMNFGLTNRVNLTGTVFFDENNNRRRDSRELLLGKVRLYIDANNNGVFDFGEKSVLTNSKGVYRFNNIVAGRYRIRTVLPYALRKLRMGNPKSDWLVNLNVSKTLTTKNFYFVD